jgi:F-type H+-transporting ATPase subunit epsilon
VKLQLITLSGVKYDEEAYSVQLPTAAGQITVLGDHEPLMSALVPGIISIRKSASDGDDRIENYATYGGVVEVTNEGPRVLVDEADMGDEINAAEAQKAHEEAQRLLSTAKTQVELEHAQALVDRHAVRLQVADIKRRHTRR